MAASWPLQCLSLRVKPFSLDTSTSGSGYVDIHCWYSGSVSSCPKQQNPANGMGKHRTRQVAGPAGSSLGPRLRDPAPAKMKIVTKCNRQERILMRVTIKFCHNFFVLGIETVPSDLVGSTMDVVQEAAQVSSSAAMFTCHNQTGLAHR